jgi:hypothetical protein
MKRLHQTWMLFAFAMLLSACAQLGLPTPETLNEKIAAAQGSVTQVRMTATQLLTAKKISVADAESVLKTTDAASEGITVARSLSAQDPNAAQARLTMIVTTLTAAQAYLASKGK